MKETRTIKLSYKYKSFYLKYILGVKLPYMPVRVKVTLPFITNIQQLMINHEKQLRLNYCRKK